KPPPLVTALLHAGDPPWGGPSIGSQPGNNPYRLGGGASPDGGVTGTSTSSANVFSSGPAWPGVLHTVARRRADAGTVMSPRSTSSRATANDVAAAAGSPNAHGCTR